MFGIQGIRVSDFTPPPKVVLLIFYSGRLSNLGQQGVIGGGEAGEETIEQMKQLPNCSNQIF